MLYPLIYYIIRSYLIVSYNILSASLWVVWTPRFSQTNLTHKDTSTCRFDIAVSIASTTACLCELLMRLTAVIVMLMMDDDDDDDHKEEDDHDHESSGCCIDGPVSFVVSSG